jgi:16S rRNA (guanine527-N7)-methyltransferase
MNPLWTQLATAAGITLTDAQASQLSRYLDLLLLANQRMNLTRITDRAAAEVHHVADALTLLPFLPKSAHRLVDVGSGGGVPGIPLAIVRPDIAVTLIESTKKKAVFLRETVTALELSNVTVADIRAEEAGTGDLRETFNVAVARAVAAMEWLAEWCLPLVRKGGIFLAMKGQKLADELPAAARIIRLAGGDETKIHPANLPGTEHHVIVEIRKLNKADKRLPRPSTSAKGKPFAG